MFLTVVNLFFAEHSAAPLHHICIPLYKPCWRWWWWLLLWTSRSKDPGS